MHYLCASSSAMNSTCSLHDALPISSGAGGHVLHRAAVPLGRTGLGELAADADHGTAHRGEHDDLGEADAWVVRIVAGRLVPRDELPPDIEDLVGEETRGDRGPVGGDFLPDVHVTPSVRLPGPNLTHQCHARCRTPARRALGPDPTSPRIRA